MKGLASRASAIRALLVSALTSCLVVLFVAPAHASQFWQIYSVIGGSARAETDGNLTFDTDGNQFTANQINVYDLAADGAGQDFYFYSYNPSDFHFSRTFYWGGGNGTSNAWFNQLIKPGMRTKYVRPVLCLVDNGNEFNCVPIAQPLLNPHY